MSYSYRYPRPALTVDAVLFGLDEGALKVLLVERDRPPFAGAWALPGGFVGMDEELEAAARRELTEETHVRVDYLEQLYTFGAVDRDPRGRVVSVAYFGLTRRVDHEVRADSDARGAAWHEARRPPPLAFDHGRILEVALERLQAKLRYRPLGFELLPRKFTLSQLQRVYEVILGREVDKRNFRKKLSGFGIVEALDEHETGPGRPARLYRFDRAKYRAMERRGFDFEL